MRNWLMVAGGGLMLAACGGGSGDSGAIPIVAGGTPTASPTPTATPTPVATPTPTATPTPAPTSSYPRYADLTGNRTFQSACAGLLIGVGLPTPKPAMPFGDALTLDYAASTAGWTISGDGVALSFAQSEMVASATGQRNYERTVAGAVQRFTVIDPVAGGTTLNFTRTFSLRTEGSTGATLYSCVFGVPASIADRPTTTLDYVRIGVNGTAYVADQTGTIQTYSLTASTGTVTYDSTVNALVVKMHLLGYLQTAGGTASTTTDLGNFSSNAAIDVVRGSFSGQIDSSDRVSLFSSLSGWYFGGSEAASSFEILAADSSTGNRVAAVGTVFAAR